MSFLWGSFLFLELLFATLLICYFSWLAGIVQIKFLEDLQLLHDHILRKKKIAGNSVRPCCLIFAFRQYLLYCGNRLSVNTALRMQNIAIYNVDENIPRNGLDFSDSSLHHIGKAFSLL